MDMWFVLALTGPLWGFLFWLVFTASHGFLYLDSFTKKLSFYFSPWMPRWYVLLKHIDGSVEQFFDMRVEKGRGRYLLRLGRAGEIIAVMEKDPDEAAVPISIWDARGPPGMPSPYGLAWRAAVGWAVAVYAAFLAWDFTFLSAMARGAAVPAEGWLSLTIFLVEFSYLWQLFSKLSTPQSKYLGLIVVGVNPPHLRVVPELSVFDPRPPAQMLGMLARRMEIVIPKEMSRIIEKLKQRLGSDEAVAAWIAAQAEMATIWRKSLAEVRSEMTTVRTVARRMIRTQSMREIMRPSFSKLLVWGFFLAVGIVIGYVFGSSWAVSTHPPPWYANVSVAHATTYSNMYTTQTPPVHAAQPPQPPTPTATATPVSPAAPPPPPAANATQAPVSPARAPPPGGG